MSSSSKLNYKLCGVVFVLILLLVGYVHYKAEIIQLIRFILEWGFLNTVLWFGVFICFFVNYISLKKNSVSQSGLIFTHFGPFGDSAFAVGTYGIASTTAASIAKGVYIQINFTDMVYFNHFSQLDIYSMLVVCCFLFGYSVYACYKALVAAIYVSGSVDALPSNKK